MQIFFIQVSVKDLNKLVNRDVKHLNNWLSANRISLNVDKTELVILNLQGKYFQMKQKSNIVGKGYIDQTQ